MLSETDNKKAIIKRPIVKLLKSLRLYSSARAVRRQVTHADVKEKYHHKKMLMFYSQLTEKGDLCFDIGANIGKFTQIFLELGAKVVCVEPLDICLKQLFKSFGDNPNVIIVGKAVGECEGFGELMVCEEAPTISTMSNKWTIESRFSRQYRWTKMRKVPVTTLNALIQSYGLPKYCKIDVEGFEESVLKGLTHTIPLISFEFTREVFGDAEKCIDRILSIGKPEFNCSLGESMEFLFQRWVTPRELYQKINSLEDTLLWGDIYARFPKAFQFSTNSKTGE